MSNKKTPSRYTWAKAMNGKNATRINNKTKEIENFTKKPNGEWRSLSRPLKPQPKSVQNKAAAIASKKKGYNVDKAFKVLGQKRPTKKKRSTNKRKR